MSSFDKDFGRQFEPVEETMVLGGDIAAKLVERYPPGDPEVAKEHRLRIIDPSGEEWEYPVHGEVMIGRAPDNHITLNDRSVSRHHLALNTDGTSYWFQDLDSGNGTQVNNEFMQEGWLIGGEEIVVGNSRLFFLLPDIEAPPEFANGNGTEVPEGGHHPEGEIDPMEGSSESESVQEEDPAPQSADSQTETPAPLTGSNGARWAVAFVLFIGLLCASLAGLWIYRQKTKNKKPKPPIRKPLTLEQKTVKLLRKGEQLLDQQKWTQAEGLLLKAASMLPVGDKFRSTILDRARVASREIKANKNFRRANKLYRNQFKTQRALVLLRKITKQSSIYPQAKKLLSLIRQKELDTQLRMANLLFEANKKEMAIAKVKKILQLDPDYNKAKAILKKLKSQAQPKPPPKKPTRRTSRNRSGSKVSLRKGLRYYRSGQITRSIIFFRRQESSARRRRTRRKARRYRRWAQTFQRNYNRGRSLARRGRASRAISSLMKAYRADASLGGNQRRKMKRLLSKLYLKRGQQRQRSGSYSRAARDFKRATQYNSKNTRAYIALKSLRRKAKALLEEGEVLIGVSNSEARKKINQAKRLLSTSDALYRKANRLLSRTQ